MKTINEGVNILFRNNLKSAVSVSNCYAITKRIIKNKRVAIHMSHFDYDTINRDLQQRDALEAEQTAIEENHKERANYWIEEGVTALTDMDIGDFLEYKFDNCLGETKNNKTPRGQRLDSSLATVTAGGLRHGLVVPYIVPIHHMGSKGNRKASVHDIKKPLNTITTTKGGMFWVKAKRMCGNSVCPPIAMALVKANFKVKMFA